MVRILKSSIGNPPGEVEVKAAAIALTTVMALSAAVVFTVPKAEAANGPCDEGTGRMPILQWVTAKPKTTYFHRREATQLTGYPTIRQATH